MCAHRHKRLLPGLCSKGACAQHYSDYSQLDSSQYTGACALHSLHLLSSVSLLQCHTQTAFCFHMLVASRTATYSVYEPGAKYLIAAYRWP